MQIELFKNNEFGAVRVITDENNEPWFVAKDVAVILGYKRPADAVRQLVDEDDKGVGKIPTPGGMQEMVIINESGLYSLILNSKLPQAKKFKRWVTSEVLPSIRKHGIYATDEIISKTLNNPDFMIELLQNLKKEKLRRQQLESEVIELKPKAFFAEVVSNSKDAILVRDFAKLISKNGFSIGQNRLFKWLREQGFLMQDNKPYQKYVDMGIFKVIERTKTDENGTKTFTTTLITGKGQVYLQKKIYEYFNINVS